MSDRTFEPMRVIALKAENFKRIEAIEIRPDGDVVEVTGRNGAGKTSVLDAIWTALKGRAVAPEEPIRDGRRRATIHLDLGPLLIERTFTKAGTTRVTVSNPEGGQYKSPQTLLDALVGELSFDPFAFMRQKAREQSATLRAVCNIDTTELDQQHARIYQERTEIGRDLKRAEAVVLDYPDDVEDFPTEAPDTAEMLEKLAEAGQHNTRVDELERHHADLMHWITETEANAIPNADKAVADRAVEVAQARAALEGAEAEAAGARERASELKRKLAEAEAEIDAAERIDTTEIQTQITAAGRLAEQAAARRQWEAARERVRTCTDERDSATSSLETIEAEKRTLLESAELPVDGLEILDDGLEYNGHPLSQASMSEQLRVSMAVAMRANPTIRVLRIADGSLLDRDAMEAIREMAAGEDFQIWIERVADQPGGTGIYIEDGAVLPPAADVVPFDPELAKRQDAELEDLDGDHESVPRDA